MSFFKKLKDKLFKSSSKLDEGLNAIVAEGAEDVVSDDEADLAVADTAVAEPEPVAEPAPEPEPEPDLKPEPKPESEPVLPKPVAEESPTPVPAPEPVATPKPVSPVVPIPEPTKTAVPPPVHRPIPQPEPAVRISPAPAPDPEPQPEAERPGILGRLFGKAATPQAPRRVLDEAMLESLEDLLIQADLGVDTALRVTANLAASHMGRKLSVDEIKGLLASEVTRIMETVARPMPLYAKKPQVVLVVGVNGSGKTTTIGKLASQFRAAGKSVVIAAGDTFRAAAVEQLQVWGQRAGVPVLTAPEGSDPASLAFDAMTQAQATGADLLLIDTAGRLQNRADLMEELSKIVRVIRKKDPDAPHNTLLVLDATTGQNALNQVEIFRKLADVSGLVMTKLDGTAKGGVLVALADKFGLPIHAIGVGEQIDDLSPFDPEEFARALCGLS